MEIQRTSEPTRSVAALKALVTTHAATERDPAWATKAAPETHEPTWANDAAPLVQTPVAMPAAARTISPIRTRPGSLANDARPTSVGRWLMLAAVGVLASATTIAGARMWHQARRQDATVRVPAAVAAIGAERLELAPDRRSIVRVGTTGPRWTSIQPAAVDTMEITGSLVLGRTSSTLVAVDLERGNTRFAWTLPAGERWSQARPQLVGSCFTALTTRGDDALVHCIDPMAGATRWTAKIAGGASCMGSPIALPGAYAVQCPGWTSVIDERTGAATVEAGGLGVVQQDPPVLLRSRENGRLMLSQYQPKQHRFSPSGTAIRGTVDAAGSVVQRNGRMIIRAASASEQIVTIASKTGAPTVVSLPELQLASDVPLVSDCDAGAAPRFQLVELAPRAGSTFDPQLARERVLALVDTDAGRVTWTSKRLLPAGGSHNVVCKLGHYFVALESGVWIFDAFTGETRAAFGFAPGSTASFATLTPEQISAEVLVGVTAQGPIAIHWRDLGAPLPSGIRDARAEIERDLGKLL